MFKKKSRGLLGSRGQDVTDRGEAVKKRQQMKDVRQ
jgi:hypothetical protein